MTEIEETIKSLKEMFKKGLCEVDEYKMAQVAINALEKQIPNKPMFNGMNWYRCVNGCEIHKKQFEKDWYCPKCGQKLDWSDTN